MGKPWLSPIRALMPRAGWPISSRTLPGRGIRCGIFRPLDLLLLWSELDGVFSEHSLPGGVLEYHVHPILWLLRERNQADRVGRIEVVINCISGENLIG